MPRAPLVVQTRAIPSDALKKAHERGDIELRVWERKGDEPEHVQCADSEWLMENVKGASALLILIDNKVDTELLDAAGDSLKVVSTMSVGLDHIDLDACKERHIRVGHSTSLYSPSSWCLVRCRRRYRAAADADDHTPCDGRGACSFAWRMELDALDAHRTSLCSPRALSARVSRG